MATAYFMIGEREKSIQISGNTLQEMQRSYEKQEGESLVEMYDSKIGRADPNKTNVMKAAQCTVNSMIAQHALAEDLNSADMLSSRQFEAVKLCHDGKVDDAIDIFKAILQNMANCKGWDPLNCVKLHMDMSNAFLLKGEIHESQKSIDAAVKLIHEGEIPRNHPVISQVQRLHRLHYKRGSLESQ
uniref:Uncharacterized protein n=1 Tax=Pseudictyota dubia TaxID=2749911 RepID=A0A7R9WFV4_9STRA